MSEPLTGKKIGKLTFNIDPGALKEIVAQGRLSEFASIASGQAAAQISAQIVEKVGAAALGQDGFDGPTELLVEYAYDDVGGFGNGPPKRVWPTGVVVVVPDPRDRNV